MAQHFLASIYAVQPPLGSYTYVGTNEGVTNSFPVEGTRFFEAKAGTTANGVTMNSIIELLPTGLNVHSFKYWSAATVATLNTAANA